jgi:hypothetical protein
MSHKKTAKTSKNSIQASVEKEMAKPRISKSAKIAQLNLDTTRVVEQPSMTIPATVDKIIPSSGPSQPEKAQISIDESNRKYQKLRIENTLTNEHGDEVGLKKGAHVEVIVTAKNPSRDS